MRQKQTAQPGKGFLATAQPFPASGGWKWRKNNRMLKWLRGKGGVRSDFLRETTWTLGQKSPLWHMTHAALTPFPAWGAPPNRLDWPCPRSLRTQQPASCSVPRMSGQPSPDWLPNPVDSGMQLPFLGLTAHLAAFTFCPSETSKVKEKSYSPNSTPLPLPTPSPRPSPPRTLGWL